MSSIFDQIFTFYAVRLSEVMSALCPVLLDIPPPTEPAAYGHDASWYPGHCLSGSALVVLNLVTGIYKLYPVHIPIFCNNSYQAEVYVAWVVLQSCVPSVSAWRAATWTFSDSQSNISALESRNDGSCPFVSALLQRCRNVSPLCIRFASVLPERVPPMAGPTSSVLSYPGQFPG